MSNSKLPQKNGPWIVNTQQTAFENPWIEVFDCDVTRPDGSPGEYGVVHFKNKAIGILPIDADGMVYLVGQHRFPLDSYSWELPEGGGPLKDDPLASAKRELMEETGYSAATWVPLVEFDVSNSVTDEKAVCFLASSLSRGKPSPDPTEVLSYKAMPFGELFRDVNAGEIRDSLTVIMVLSARTKALLGELPAPICELLLKT